VKSLTSCDLALGTEPRIYAQLNYLIQIDKLSSRN
jgi:hypothetical protein